jgi:nicotinamide mononucleotide transporter
MNWTEILGFVTGIASVWLAVRGRVETFPVGIANNIFFFVLFAEAALYADAALQVAYVALSLAGWWAWLRLGPNRTSLQVTDASPRLLLATAGGVALATAARAGDLRLAGALPRREHPGSRGARLRALLRALRAHGHGHPIRSGRPARRRAPA